MTSAADAPFTPEQQEYLKGFMAGVEARRGASPGSRSRRSKRGADPADPHRAAQDRAVAARRQAHRRGGGEAQEAPARSV